MGDKFLKQCDAVRSNDEILPYSMKYTLTDLLFRMNVSSGSFKLWLGKSSTQLETKVKTLRKLLMEEFTRWQKHWYAQLSVIQNILDRCIIVDCGRANFAVIKIRVKRWVLIVYAWVQVYEDDAWKKKFGMLRDNFIDRGNSIVSNKSEEHTDNQSAPPPYDAHRKANSPPADNGYTALLSDSSESNCDECFETNHWLYDGTPEDDAIVEDAILDDVTDIMTQMKQVSGEMLKWLSDFAGSDELVYTTRIGLLPRKSDRLANYMPVN